MIFLWVFSFENLVIFLFSLLFLYLFFHQSVWVTFMCVFLPFPKAVILACAQNSSCLDHSDWPAFSVFSLHSIIYIDSLQPGFPLRICNESLHIRLRLLVLAFRMSQTWLIFLSNIVFST